MKGIVKGFKKKTHAFFHGAGKAPPSPRVSRQNDVALEGSLPLSPPTNGDTAESSQPTSSEVIIPNPSTQEAPSSFLLHGGSNADGPKPSSLSNTDTTAAQLSPPVLAIPYNSSSNVNLQLQPPPQASSSRSINSADNLGPSNEVVPRIDDYNLQGHGGNFGQVQRVSMENPAFYEFHGNQNVNYYGNAGPLKQLADHAMLDAAFDSSARDPPPRCHPGTRLDILQLIQKRLDEVEKEAQVIWLEGAAGVGKSAIMQTIAEADAENNALGASVFFSRPNNRDDPQMVFTTIAFQLAVKDPSYQQYITQRIVADPSFLRKTMERQFRDLIVVPFAQQKLLGAHRKYMIVLDGLDECKDTREQRRIIRLIGDFVSHHPTIPLRWVIASRPEQHLVVCFSEIKTVLKTAYWEKQIPVDSEQSVRDVELYLHNEFTRIRNNNHDLTATYEKWPSEKQSLIISSAASGLFVFASTVIRFVDDDENPVHRLNLVISVLEKQMKQNLRTNPLALLDALYERILSDISSDTLDTVKLVLGYLIIRPHIDEDELRAEPFWVCNFLDMEQHVLYGALRKLRSVLSFPEPERASGEQVRFLHASFSDYLEDRKRSHNYSVNLDDIATYLWHRFMTILQQWMKTNSHDSVEYAWSIESITKLMQSQRDTTDWKRRLPESVRWSWSILLQKHFDSGPFTTFRLLIPIEDLIKDIGKLDYSFKWTLPTTQHRTNDLIECLEAHTPADHRKDLIREFSLASLDRKQLLSSLYERPWINGTEPFVFSDPQTRQIFENDLEKFEEFARAESQYAHQVLDMMRDANASGPMVKVLGARPSKCRALLIHKGKPAHCFPYIATGSGVRWSSSENVAHMH